MQVRARPSQYKIDDDCTNEVRDYCAERPCLINGVAGAEEQARADNAAEGNHDQVAGCHRSLQSR
jgi:hypothetical protein